MRAMLVSFVLVLSHFAMAAEPAAAPAATPSPSPAPASEVRSDRLFHEGKVGDTPVFTQETHIDYDGQGGKTWNSVIKDAESAVVMTELATLKNDRVVSQTVEQRQIGRVYDLVITGDKANFRTSELADGKHGKEIENKTVDVTDRFLMGPMTDSSIQKNWDLLMSGKTIKADFGVFEAARTIEFKFFKNKDIGDDVEIHMKPASFVIAMLVPTIKLRFNKTTRKLVYFCGPTPLKFKDGSKMKDFAAEIFYP